MRLPSVFEQITGQPLSLDDWGRKNCSAKPPQTPWLLVIRGSRHQSFQEHMAVHTKEDRKQSSGARLCRKCGRTKAWERASEVRHSLSTDYPRSKMDNRLIISRALRFARGFMKRRDDCRTECRCFEKFVICMKFKFHQVCLEHSTNVVVEANNEHKKAICRIYVLQVLSVTDNEEFGNRFKQVCFIRPITNYEQPNADYMS